MKKYKMSTFDLRKYEVLMKLTKEELVYRNIENENEFWFNLIVILIIGIVIIMLWV